MCEGEFLAAAVFDELHIVTSLERARERLDTVTACVELDAGATPAK